MAQITLVCNIRMESNALRFCMTCPGRAQSGEYEMDDASVFMSLWNWVMKP